MKEVVIYIILISIAAVFVIINYKKSHGSYRNRKHKKFRDSYLEKRKQKEKDEDLH